MESLGEQIERTQTPAFKITYGKRISASNWKIWGMANKLVSETVVGLLSLYDAVKAKQPERQPTIFEYAESLEAGANDMTPLLKNEGITCVMSYDYSKGLEIEAEHNKIMDLLFAECAGAKAAGDNVNLTVGAAEHSAQMPANPAQDDDFADAVDEIKRRGCQ